MTTPFLPPLDSMWELTQDWRAPRTFMSRYGNTEFVENMGVELGLGSYQPYKDNPSGWGTEMIADYHKWYDEQIAAGDTLIPAGSIFSMERYHVSRSGEDEITLMMYRSPRLEISPRKRGGKGKGKMRFYVSLAEFNTFGLLKEFSE